VEENMCVYEKVGLFSRAQSMASLTDTGGSFGSIDELWCQCCGKWYKIRGQPSDLQINHTAAVAQIENKYKADIYVDSSKLNNFP
jgi:hypothetical protein